jgi:N-acetylglucosaminyl-diphospho-decaprenol L-rhamnosyltransferase
MDLSIIIVNWNSREYLRKCIESVRAHAGDQAIEIVVIDSASFDGCGEMLREQFPDVRFVQSETNLGFARANNIAFESSTGATVLFLNPDTEVVGPALAVMYTALHSVDHAGIVGCRLLNDDGTVQTSCVQAIPTILNQLLDAEALRTRWPRLGLWGTAPLYDQSQAPSEIEAISGACLMIRRSTFEEVGRFSEDYFMYAEDIDLAYKVRKAGYRNYYVPGGTVVHYGGSSSQQAESRFSVVMTREANWRFLRKSRGAAYAFGYRAAMGASAIVRLGLIAARAVARRAGRRHPPTDSSFRKWRAILVWSVNLDTLVKQYYGENAAPAPTPLATPGRTTTADRAQARL